MHKYGLTDLKLINTRHGAGDREGSFDDRSGAFDLTLLPGQKYVDRLNELGYLRPGTYAVVGWPKFEVVGGLNERQNGSSATLTQLWSTVRISIRRYPRGIPWGYRCSISLLETPTTI